MNTLIANLLVLSDRERPREVVPVTIRPATRAGITDDWLCSATTRAVITDNCACSGATRGEITDH